MIRVHRLVLIQAFHMLLQFPLSFHAQQVNKRESENGTLDQETKGKGHFSEP